MTSPATWNLEVLWDYTVKVKLDPDAGTIIIDRMEVKNVGDAELPAGRRLIIKAIPLNRDATPTQSFTLHDTGVLPTIPPKATCPIMPHPLEIPDFMKRIRDKWWIQLFIDGEDEPIYRSPPFTIVTVPAMELEQEAIHAHRRETKIQLWKLVFEAWRQQSISPGDNPQIYRHIETARGNLEPLLFEVINENVSDATQGADKAFAEALLENAERALEILLTISADDAVRPVEIIQAEYRVRETRKNLTQRTPPFERLLNLTPRHLPNFGIAISAAKVKQGARSVRAVAREQTADRARSAGDTILSREEIGRNIAPSSQNTPPSSETSELTFQAYRDRIFFNFVTDRPCYITFLDLTTDGQIIIPIPEKGERTRYIPKGGDVHHLPEAESGWDVIGEGGRSLVKVLTTVEEVPMLEGWSGWEYLADQFRVVPENRVVKFANYLERRIKELEAKGIVWAEGSCVFCVT